MDLKLVINEIKNDIKEKERTLISQSKGREYISDALISTILHYHSLSVLLTYTTKHFIVKTTIKCLLEMPIENWSFNRPPDQLRCAEISEYILNEKTVLDSVFYLVYNNKKGVFEVYDGSHRLGALKIAIPFVVESELNWLLNSEILINIRFNTRDEDVQKAFKSLNKSIPVPDLYIRDVKREKKQMIEKVTNEWIANWQQHFTTSLRPNIGNTNRDSFIGFLEQIYDKYDIDEESECLFLDRIHDIHTWTQIHLPRKVSPIVQKKCQESGCYLFLHKFDILLQYI